MIQSSGARIANGGTKNQILLMGIATLVSTGIIQATGKSEYIELTKEIGSVLTENANDLKAIQ